MSERKLKVAGSVAFLKTNMTNSEDKTLMEYRVEEKQLYEQ